MLPLPPSMKSEAQEQSRLFCLLLSLLPELLVNWPPNSVSFSSFFFFLVIIFKIYLFIYFWLCWVFVSVRGLSLVAASGGHSSSWCTGLSLSWPLLLRSTGSRRTGSVVVAHGPSCSAACGIFPDQGSNPCPLHWQADSQPLHHQGSPLLPLKRLSTLPLLPPASAVSEPSSCLVWSGATASTYSLCFQFPLKIYPCVSTSRPSRQRICPVLSP